jgi:hypothetical protein
MVGTPPVLQFDLLDCNKYYSQSKVMGPKLPNSTLNSSITFSNLVVRDQRAGLTPGGFRMPVVGLFESGVRERRLSVHVYML